MLNSGFENGLTQWTRKNGQIQLDTTDSHSGSQSVLCLGRAASHHGVQQNMLSGSSSGSPRIVPNSKYRISCWAKLKNAASDTLRLKVKYEDEDGPHFKGISTVIYNNVWTLLEGYITVDEISSGGGTITAAKLFIVGPEAGVEFWVDDVSMEFMNAVTSAPTPSPPTPSPTTKVSYYVCIFGLGFLYCASQLNSDHAKFTHATSTSQSLQLHFPQLYPQLLRQHMVPRRIRQQ